MKRFFSLTLGLLAAMASQAADTIYTKAPQIPILLERNDNVLFYMRMDAKDTKTLDEVSINRLNSTTAVQKLLKTGVKNVSLP